MTDNEAREVAASLTEARRRALLAMSGRATFPGKGTFSAPAAWSLSCVRPELARVVWATIQTTRVSRKRQMFFLTPLGLQVHAILRTKESDK